jgi:hypothetical protein
MPKRTSPEMQQEKSKRLQEHSEKIRKILSGETPPTNSPVIRLSIEEQKRLGIPTESVSIDLNPLRRD